MNQLEQRNAKIIPVMDKHPKLKDRIESLLFYQ